MYSVLCLGSAQSVAEPAAAAAGVKSRPSSDCRRPPTKTFADEISMVVLRLSIAGRAAGRRPAATCFMSGCDPHKRRVLCDVQQIPPERHSRTHSSNPVAYCCPSLKRFWVGYIQEKVNAPVKLSRLLGRQCAKSMSPFGCR